MISELQKTYLSFRGLSDEDEEEDLDLDADSEDEEETDNLDEEELVE